MASVRSILTMEEDEAGFFFEDVEKSKNKEIRAVVPVPRPRYEASR